MLTWYRHLPRRVRTLISTAVKLVVTIGGFWLLLAHQVSSWADVKPPVYVAPWTSSCVAVEVNGEALPAVFDRAEVIARALDHGPAFFCDAVAGELLVHFPEAGPRPWDSQVLADGADLHLAWHHLDATASATRLEAAPGTVTVDLREPVWKVWKRSGELQTATRFDSAEALLAPRALSTSGYVWDEASHTITVRLPGDAAAGKRVRTQAQGAIGTVRIVTAIRAYVSEVDPTTFVLFALLAMAVKFVGVLASAGSWALLLRGQGLRFPFWQQVVTAFLIGRFIGTFLPSTIGLDAYTLYEAGRYSNQWHRAITAKVLEKFLGIAGLFAGVLLTLPAGFLVLQAIGDRSGLVTGLIGLASASITGGVVLGLVRPGLLQAILRTFGRMLPRRVTHHADRFTDAVAAYHGQLGLLFAALLGKFVTHFTTAVVYFFTALAIGVVGAQFLPIVFGSLLQIFGTLLSPTIAGEGAREALQAMLLSNFLGGPAQAVLSAALGFVAAEAATLWGGAFLWTRRPAWRPTWCMVDGAQVDYAWLADDQGGFDADRIAAAARGAPPA